MSQERLLKRGELAELQDEQRLIERRAAVQVAAVKSTVDGPMNLFHMDLALAAVAVSDLQQLQVRYRQVVERVQELKKELGL